MAKLYCSISEDEQSKKKKKKKKEEDISQQRTSKQLGPHSLLTRLKYTNK